MIYLLTVLYLLAMPLSVIVLVVAELLAKKNRSTFLVYVIFALFWPLISLICCTFLPRKGSSSMSRRSLKAHNTLGYPLTPGRTPHDTHPSQCGGDMKRYRSTRPSTIIHGTGRWLGHGGGVGEVVTRPEGQSPPKVRSLHR